MAYRLKASEAVNDALRRVAGEELESAAAQVGGQGESNRDEAIHEARKSVKKVRAVLRLTEAELGKTFRQENVRLRNVGRKLSNFRDAGAIIETFDGLREKYREELGRRTLGSVKKALVSRKREAEQHAGIEQVFETLAKRLNAAAARVQSWPLHTDGFPALGPGLKRTYRRGRNAMAAAKKHSRPEDFHDWRKRVKDHWYHVRLLEGVWTDVMQAYEKNLKELETWLGDDHNLVVMRDQIKAEPGSYGNAKDVELLLQLIDKYQKELRDNALSLGARLYEEKPRQFATRMEHLWAEWKQQPDTLKDVLEPVGRKAAQSAPAEASQEAPSNAA